MSMQQIININGEWGTYTWADGFKPSNRLLSLRQEVRKNLEAVINRLMNQGRWDEAEALLDTLA